MGECGTNSLCDFVLLQHKYTYKYRSIYKRYILQLDNRKKLKIRPTLYKM